MKIPPTFGIWVIRNNVQLCISTRKDNDICKKYRVYDGVWSPTVIV
jgi:hypothetical protein